MGRARTASGFTMIEVLASVVLLGVGIVAALSAVGAMTQTETKLRESEVMQRLAGEKLDELIGTGDWQFATEGDFLDRNNDRFSWTASLEPTGVENLEVLTVTVTRNQIRNDLGTVASEVLYVPPTAGGASP